MNLYNLHNDPRSLHKHQEAHDTITDIIFDEIRKGKRINDRQLTALASNPDAGVVYAVKYLRGRFREAEPTIAKVALASYEYAEKAIERRFPAGEKAIASDPTVALLYARNVIEGPWPEGEKAIASHPMRARSYALFVLKDKFPAGERAISKEPSFVKQYNEMLEKKGYSNEDLIDVKKDINKTFHP